MCSTRLFSFLCKRNGGSFSAKEVTAAVGGATPFSTAFGGDPTLLEVVATICEECAVGDRSPALAGQAWQISCENLEGLLAKMYKVLCDLLRGARDRAAARPARKAAREATVALRVLFSAQQDGPAHSHASEGSASSSEEVTCKTDESITCKPVRGQLSSARTAPDSAPARHALDQVTSAPRSNAVDGAALAHAKSSGMPKLAALGNGRTDGKAKRDASHAVAHDKHVRVDDDADTAGKPRKVRAHKHGKLLHHYEAPWQSDVTGQLHTRVQRLFTQLIQPILGRCARPCRRPACPALSCTVSSCRCSQPEVHQLMLCSISKAADNIMRHILST